MPKKLTTDELQARLSADGRGLMLIGEYKNIHTKTCFKGICGHSWMAAPSNILAGYGCPFCAGNARRTSADVRQLLIEDGRGISLISEYVSSSTAARFRCANGHEWDTLPLHVITKGSGCPHCAGRHKTTESINARLVKRGFSLIGEYIGMNAKHVIRCEKGHEWPAVLSNVLTNGSGCPCCAQRGILAAEHGFVYVMDYGDGQYTKIGVATDPRRRLRELRSESPHPIELVALFDAGTGRDAFEMEQAIHRRFKAFNAGLTGFAGATELFHVSPATAAALIRKLGGVPLNRDALRARWAAFLAYRITT